MCAAESAVCARAAPQLLAHVNLLLAAFGGAALATGARLKWDPTTYVVLRELAPGEYRAAALLLPAAGAALLLLAHLALAALARAPAHPATARRLMLLIYAVLTSLMIFGEVALGVWAWRRAAAWLRATDAADLQAALALRQHLIALLVTLARWHPLPNAIKDVIEEVESDGPRNGYVVGAASAALLLLQAAGVALALLSRRRRTRAPADSPPAARRRRRRSLTLRSDSVPRREEAPLSIGDDDVR